MKLTVGATLQDGKYVIQEVVIQNDWSITYKAAHTYLDHTVLLQTFSETVHQQSDFAQLAQQFIERVRHLAKQPVVNGFHVLDCFREGDRPFVVLEFIPDRPPLPLNEWFACSSHPGDRHTHDVETKNLHPSQPNQPATLEVTPAPVIADSPTAVSLNGMQPPSPVHTEAATTLTSPAASSRRPSKNVTVTIGKSTPVKQPNSKAQLPVALMVMALVGGSVGAGMGVAMRVSTASSPQGSKPRINLFNREQSFPPTQEWPVQEEAIYTPQPAIEQPLYRNPAETYTPSMVPSPLPAETTVLPDPVNPPAATTEPSPIDAPTELPPLKPKSRISQDPLPPVVDPPMPEAPSVIDQPPPLPDPIAPPAVTPQPVLPPINAAPVPPVTKPLPNNSHRTTL